MNILTGSSFGIARFLKQQNINRIWSEIMKKRTAITAVILTLIMTFMEMSALPAALFCNIKIEDIDPIYITLMLNFYWLLRFVGYAEGF